MPRARTLATLLLLTCSPAFAECPGPRPPGMGPLEPSSVLSADLDGVNGPDLVFARQKTDEILVSYNQGDGTFSEPLAMPMGDRPEHLAVADLDGLAGLDVVVGHHGEQVVSVLLNDGTGTLQAPVTYPAGWDPVVADMDGANGPDLLLFSGRQVSLLFNTGSGTFGAPESLALTLAPQAAGGAVVELDGMNGPDLVVGGGASGPVFLYNDGTGRLGGEQRLPLDGQTLYPVAVDLDGLHGLDIVARGQTPGGEHVARVSLHTGNGYPTWTDYPLDADSPRLNIRAADIDGRNGNDLVFGDPRELRVLFNAGDGTFSAPVRIGTETPLGLHVADIDVADLDGADGPDIIVANWVGGARIFWNDGTGGFPFGWPREPTVADAGGPNDVLAIDLAGTPALDLLTVHRDASDLSVRVGRGDGTFEAPVRIPIPGPARQVALIEPAGEPRELAITLYDDGDVLVMRETGELQFEVAQVIDLTQGGVDAIAVADVDGVNGPDLGVCDWFGPSVLRRGADGSYGPPERYMAGTSPGGVAFADFDGDERAEMVVGSYNDSTVRVLPNMGDGTFGAPQSFETTVTPLGLAPVDVDGVNGPDLVAVAEYDLSVYLNQGDGTFGPRITQAADTWPHRVVVADIDGRNGPDVVGTGGLDELVVFRNRGDGTFAPVERRDAGHQPEGLAVAQLDGEGGLEIVVANARGDDLSLLSDCELGTRALLRSTEVVSLSPTFPPLSDVLAPNVWGDSLDDSDTYLTDFASGDVDPAPGGPEQPLVFYQVSDGFATIRLFKEPGGAVRVEY